jgi:predicted aspartyl protease
MLNLLMVLAPIIAAQPDHNHAPTPVVELAGDAEAKIPMTFRGSRPVVDIRINGKGPFKFYFDTGASGPIMSQKLMKELDLKQIGEAQIMSGGDGPDKKPIPGQIVSLDSVDFGPVKLSNLWIVAMERAQLEGDSGPLGVLSPNAFRGHLTDQGYLVVVDYPKKEICIRPGSLGEPDGKTIFAYQPKKVIPSMMMKVAGEEIEGHLDTGSSGFVSLPPRLAEKLPLDGPLVETKRKARSVRGDFPIKEGKLNGTVTFGQFTIDHPTIEFSDVVRFGNLGSQFLERYVITLDIAKRRFQLAEAEKN